jgi:antitoxin (DNA-binding transcriptional repressor) of toxin-antitoxin stability system
MKLIGIRDAHRSWATVLSDAQGEPVCVMRHGKPFAVVVGVDGRDVRDVLKSWDPEFSDGGPPSKSKPRAARRPAHPKG